MVDLNELKIRCKQIHDRRIENGARVEKDILKHLATEVVEAVEARDALCLRSSWIHDYAEELADIIICALIAAADDGIDIEKAVLEKVGKNRRRAEMQGDKL